MRYTIKLWDKRELLLSQEDGEKVMYAKEKGIGCVRLNGGVYETKSISYIEPVKEEPNNLLPEPQGKPVSKQTLQKVRKELDAKFNW